MPQWEDIQRRAPDALHFTAINAQQHPELARAAHVHGVPHLEVHVKGTVHLYEGARTASALLEFVDSLLHTREPDDRTESAPVVRVVWFHAPWCGHCRNMRSAWDDATGDGRVLWTAIDCDAHPEVATKEGVQGFPTIRAYVKGKMLMEHDGPRDVAALREFATRALEAIRP
jgi:thioredoxin-like negative regulator of GroEL